MSFLRSPSLFQTLSPNHGDDVFVSNAAGKLKEQKRLRPTSSFANLIKFVRNPLENVGEAVEDWYDGTSKEERERKQAVEDRKQLLYLKMRTVGLLRPIAIATRADLITQGDKSYRLGSSSKGARRARG